MNFITILQTTAPAVEESKSGNNQWIFMIGIAVVFYVFMILPQMRKNKKQKVFASSLAVGENIITTSGMHGKIIKLDDSTAIIELEDKQKVKIERSSISMDMSAALKTKA